MTTLTILEWIAGANLAVTLLLIPLGRKLWSIDRSVAMLDVKTEHCARETADLREEIARLRVEVTATSVAAATASAIAAHIGDK